MTARTEHQEKVREACRRVFDAVADGTLDSSEVGHAALLVAACVADMSGLRREAFARAAKMAHQNWRGFIAVVTDDPVAPPPAPQGLIARIKALLGGK